MKEKCFGLSDRMRWTWEIGVWRIGKKIDWSVLGIGMYLVDVAIKDVSEILKAVIQ